MSSLGNPVLNFDINKNGVVDKTEGIEKVTEFPDNPVEGNLVLKDGQLYI